MPITFPVSFDRTNNSNLYESVSPGDIYYALDGDDNLWSESRELTFRDGYFWTVPSVLSGGVGDDSYNVGYDDAAIIADAGNGRDRLKVYRNYTDIYFALKIDGRHLALGLTSYIGSPYETTILIVDAFKPSGSIETFEFSDYTFNVSYDQIVPLIKSSGLYFEDLSWNQAIAKKYFNLSTIGVANNSSGADELMDHVYKTGNPVTDSGVHRFFDPIRGVHFYTDGIAEVNHVRSRLGNYNYEGKVYDPVTGINGTQLYRFFNARAGYHFMTASAEEAAFVERNPEWGYTQESRSYSVSTESTSESATPVYRFFKVVSGTGTHFYTSSEAERQSILDNPSWGYQSEGVAWYVA